MSAAKSDSGRAAEPPVYTPGRFAVSWTSAQGARDPISLTSEVKTLRERMKHAGYDAALMLVVVADDELDAALEIVSAALEVTTEAVADSKEVPS